MAFSTSFITERRFLVIWPGTLASCLLLFWLAVNQRPVVCGDSVAYWPPVIHGAAADSFENPVWRLAAVYDPQGLGRLTYHGFMLPVVCRWLGASDYAGVYRSVAFLGIATLLIFSSFLSRVLLQSGGIGVCVLMSMMPSALAHFFLGVFSRPEALVMLLSSVLAWVLWCMPVRPWIGSVSAGVLVAAAGLTSPVAGMLLGAVACVAAAVSFPMRQLVAVLLVFSLTAGATAWGLFNVVYGFPVRDWVAGNLNHAQAAVWTVSGGGFARYLLADTRSLGLLPLLLAAVICVMPLILMKDVLLWQVLPPLLAFAAMCWLFGLREPQRFYNLQGLAPLMLAGLAVWLAKRASNHGLSTWLRGPGMILSLMALSTGTLGLLRHVVLLAFFQQECLSYEAARELAGRYLAASEGRLDVSNALLTLSEDPRLRGAMIGGPLDGEYFLLAQTGSGRSEPPVLPGFEVVENHFARQAPTLGWLKLGNSPAGYNLAVYKRVGHGL